VEEVMNLEAMSDKAILAEIGQRVQLERLNRDLAQDELARKAGVSRRALQKLEAGQACNLASLLKLLRAFGKLDTLDTFLPPRGISPIQLAKLKGRERQRASGRRNKQNNKPS
jgi:putative transcriptional regulator